MNQPVFIVVDGGDGSGKDTQAKRIANYYLQKDNNFIVRYRSHPSLDNPFGRRAKWALEKGGKKGHLAAAFFYTIDVIRSLVKYYRYNNNEVIIFSRYLLGVCYLPTSLITFGYELFSHLLPISKYFFYLDVNPMIARDRITKRGGKHEMFENLPRLRKMRRKMRFLTSKYQWYQINGDESPQRVWEQICAILTQLDSTAM